MRFAPGEIEGIILIEPQVFGDSRGHFFEAYHDELFKKNGIQDHFVQDNQSLSARGVLRGLHYQIPPKAQAKLVRVLKGEIFDVAVDLRKGSKTFGRHAGCLLSAANRRMLYIPKGFAHGFVALADNTEVLYKVSDAYSPDHERGILWNDPSLAIDWPKCDGPVLVSEKDLRLSTLSEAVL